MPVRPEYTHGWGSKTYYTRMRLDPLGRESAEEMLVALLGEGTELGPLKHLIIERTEGNPFFIEETVQSLFEEGVLVRNGAVKLTRPPGTLTLPPTVQGMLAVRIDKLPPEQKELRCFEPVITPPSDVTARSIDVGTAVRLQIGPRAAPAEGIPTARVGPKRAIFRRSVLPPGSMCGDRRERHDQRVIHRRHVAQVRRGTAGRRLCGSVLRDYKYWR